MAKLPFMKFYPADFLMDCQTLTLAELGGWIKLICYIWHKSDNGEISITNREIASLWGVDVDEACNVLLSLAEQNFFDFQRSKNGDHDDADLVVNHIKSRRIEKDKKALLLNALSQDRHRSKARVRHESEVSKTKVRDKKSEVRSQKSDKDLPSPETSEVVNDLLTRIRVNKPDFQKTPEELKGWERDAALILGKDGRSLKNVRAVIAWCQSDPFWRSNILSVAKLRKQFDQLEMKMQSELSKSATPPANWVEREMKKIQEKI